MASMCWTSSFKTSWKKKEMKEKDPRGTPKTLMYLARAHKPNGGKNFEGNPKWY
jgi:hypothetical protein